MWHISDSSVNWSQSWTDPHSQKNSNKDITCSRLSYGSKRGGHWSQRLHFHLWVDVQWKPANLWADSLCLTTLSYLKNITSGRSYKASEWGGVSTVRSSDWRESYHKGWHSVLLQRVVDHQFCWAYYEIISLMYLFVSLLVLAIIDWVISVIQVIRELHVKWCCAVIQQHIFTLAGMALNLVARVSSPPLLIDN